MKEFSPNAQELDSVPPGSLGAWLSPYLVLGPQGARGPRALLQGVIPATWRTPARTQSPGQTTANPKPSQLVASPLTHMHRSWPPSRLTRSPAALGTGWAPGGVTHGLPRDAAALRSSLFHRLEASRPGPLRR